VGAGVRPSAGPGELQQIAAYGRGCNLYGDPMPFTEIQGSLVRGELIIVLRRYGTELVYVLSRLGTGWVYASNVTDPWGM
jgi:hypothetical protein